MAVPNTTSRTTSTALPVEKAERYHEDYRTAVLFMNENGREPTEDDGEPYAALQRCRSHNLQAQATTPAQPSESESVTSWRQTTAARMLTQLPRPARRRMPRARERGRGRRAVAAARGGDSGATPPK